MINLSDKGTKIVFWNVRSLWNKLDNIKQHLTTSNYHFFGLVESWLKPNVCSNLIDIPDYYTFRNDRQTLRPDGQIKRGGGLLVYCKNYLNVTQLTGLPFTVSNQDIESLVICFKEKYTKKCYIITVYQPPDGDVDTFCDQLDKLCKSLPDRENSDIILGGDFNINFAKNSNHKSTLTRISKRFSLTQYIKEPTRPLYGDNIVDLIFCNSNKVQYTGLLNWNVSDHVPVIVNIKKQKTYFEKDKFIGRSYRLFNEDRFIQSLNMLITEEHLNRLTNVNDQWDYFFDTVKNSLDLMCPVREFSFKKEKPPWLTHDLIELIKDKDHLLTRARKSKKEDDKINARHARNLVNALIKRARSDFVREQLDTHRNDPKKFWEIIKTVFGNNSSKTPLYLTDDDNNPVPDTNIAEHVNSFFTQIGLKLANTINETHGPDLAHQRDLPVGYHVDYDTFQWTRFTVENVVKEVSAIHVHKSSGFTQISSKIWKIVFLQFPQVLTNLFNMSVETGIFPDKWKIGTIIPIPKVANPTKTGELRPISLLPITSKLLEHLMHHQLSHFIEQNNILTNYQNGFRPKRSTIQTVFDFTTNLYQINNSNRDTLALYIDYQKAFDTVNHNRLIKKFRELNFGNEVCTWLYSYLSNRTQNTFVNNTVSSSLPISYGVPQGSVLGPLLFIVYLNDITKCVHDCKYFLYADDIVLYKDIDSLIHPNGFEYIQNDVTRIEDWCKLNELTVNVLKTKAQFFPRNKFLDCDAFKRNNYFTMGNQIIGYTDTFKYLGVEIDSNLLFKSHINRLNKNANHKLFLLRRLKNVLTTFASTLVLKSMFLGVLDYGLLFTTVVPNKMIDDLQVIQNHALRAVLNVQDPQDLNVIVLHDLVKVKLLKHRMYIQIMMCMRNSFLNKSLPVLERDMVTRANDGATFFLPIPRLKSLRKCPFYLGSQIWNHLPFDIRTTDSKTLYKDFITKGIMNNTIRTIFQH